MGDIYVLPLPNPTRFVDKSKAENTMVLCCVSGSFLMTSGLRLLLEVGSMVTEMHSWSAMMSVSVR